MANSIRAWSTPEVVTAAAQKLFDNGALLRSLHDKSACSSLFPHRVRLRGPRQTELVDAFADASSWARQLRTDAANRGWRLTTRVLTSRSLGRQDIPATAVIDTPNAALALLSSAAQQSAADFANALSLVDTGDSPIGMAIRAVALARPHHVLAAGSDWPILVASTHWLVAHPRPGIHVRELPVLGARTKLLEERRPLASALFDACLPDSAVDNEADTFEKRYGFDPRQREIRLRGPGRALGIAWTDYTQVSWPLDALAGFNPVAAGITEAVIVENRLSFGTVPLVPGRLVVFGEGYAVEDTANRAKWMTQVRVRYWGDIDTHGLRIVARLRRSLPHAETVLMDECTLGRHRPRWGQEPSQASIENAELLLTAEEVAVLTHLRDGSWGERVRLEQEHIDSADVAAAFARLSDD